MLRFRHALWTCQQQTYAQPSRAPVIVRSKGSLHVNAVFGCVRRLSKSLSTTTHCTLIARYSRSHRHLKIFSLPIIPLFCDVADFLEAPLHVSQLRERGRYHPPLHQLYYRWTLTRIGIRYSSIWQVNTRLEQMRLRIHGTSRSKRIFKTCPRDNGNTKCKPWALTLILLYPQ